MKPKAALVLAVWTLLFGLAAVANPGSAQGQAQQTTAERCFERHQFGAQPVDVAKTADGETVLAQVSWGYHDTIGCYLSLDEDALAAIRATPPPQSLPDASTEASQRCFERHQFGAQPVDVAKTADGQTVLARLSWGYHDTIGCYLVLDDTALTTLRAAGATNNLAQGTLRTKITPSVPFVAANQPFEVAVEFERAVSGFDSSDISVANGKVISLSGSGSEYRAVVQPSSPGSVVMWIPEDASHDQSGNGNDRSPPFVANSRKMEYTSIAVDVGRNYSCTIRTDRTIACWGTNYYGQSDAPDGQHTAIATGKNHSCAIRTDRTIACWGSNYYGQSDAPDGQYTAIATGVTHSCAINTDRTIACWGNNNYGQSDAPDGQYTAIATTCAIRTDRTIACWGGNYYGQSDAPDGQYTAIATGDNYSCAINTDRAIACWGDNGRVPTRAAPNTGQYTAIATGPSSACAIRVDQTVACWGAKQSVDNERVPDGQYTAIATDHTHSCAIKTDRTIACWGTSYLARTYAASDTGQFTAIATAYSHSCAIRTDRTIACWGRSDAPDGQYTAIDTSRFHSCAIRTDRTIACWGNNNSGQSDAPDGQYTAIATGKNHSCAIRTDHTIACWGANHYGETDAPDGQYTAIATGKNHACAIKTDRTIACWGRGWDYINNWRYILDKSQLETVVWASDKYRQGPLSCELNTNQTLLCWSGSLQDHPAESESHNIERAVTNSSEFLDTWDRDAVVTSYDAEFTRKLPDPNWTGNIGSCVAGTTSQPYRDSIFQRINWYRQMAGVLPTVEDPERSRKAQGKALIMAAEGRLSHGPPDDWACYTRQAAVAGGSESLVATSGIRAINAYMEDYGENNKVVGHRGMVIDSVARRFGTGDIPGAANALQGGTRSRYKVQRGYLAWPPPGYVPYRVVWRRWSFHQPGNYSRATVTVVNDNGPVESEIVYAGGRIVWEMATPGVPDGDLCYTVTISGVQFSDGTQTTYEYVTCVIDPRE